MSLPLLNIIRLNLACMERNFYLLVLPTTGSKAEMDLKSNFYSVQSCFLINREMWFTFFFTHLSYVKYSCVFFFE